MYLARVIEIWTTTSGDAARVADYGRGDTRPTTISEPHSLRCDAFPVFFTCGASSILGAESVAPITVPRVLTHAYSLVLLEAT